MTTKTNENFALFFARLAAKEADLAARLACGEQPHLRISSQLAAETAAFWARSAAAELE